MKKFTKEQIDGTREHFKAQGYLEATDSVDGVNLSYFVLPVDLCGELPHFVFHCSNGQDEGVYGISEAMPQEFRKYAILHEVVESGLPESPERCRYALVRELEAVPQEHRAEYIGIRRAFFSNLVEYAVTRDYPSDEVEAFRGSKHHLEKLIADIGGVVERGP